MKLDLEVPLRDPENEEAGRVPWALDRMDTLGIGRKAVADIIAKTSGAPSLNTLSRWFASTNVQSAPSSEWNTLKITLKRFPQLKPEYFFLRVVNKDLGEIPVEWLKKRMDELGINERVLTKISSLNNSIIRGWLSNDIKTKKTSPEYWNRVVDALCLVEEGYISSRSTDVERFSIREANSNFPPSPIEWLRIKMKNLNITPGQLGRFVAGGGRWDSRQSLINGWLNCNVKTTSHQNWQLIADAIIDLETHQDKG